MSEDKLNKIEEQLFESLEREQQPPAHLEEQLVTQLKFEGHIKSNKMNNLVKWVAGVAAAGLIFLAGSWYGQSNNRSLAIAPERGYMLLLHEDENFAPGDPMEMFHEYAAWMDSTFARGVTITGQELVNESILVKSSEPLKFLGNEVDTRTTGYFILEAKSMEEALAVAQANPHVKYGGTVEVKQYMVR